MNEARHPGNWSAMQVARVLARHSALKHPKLFCLSRKLTGVKSTAPERSFAVGLFRSKFQGLQNIVLILIACSRDPHGTTVLRTPLAWRFSKNVNAGRLGLI